MPSRHGETAPASIQGPGPSSVGRGHVVPLITVAPSVSRNLYARIDRMVSHLPASVDYREEQQWRRSRMTDDGLDVP